MKNVFFFKKKTHNFAIYKTIFTMEEKNLLLNTYYVMPEVAHMATK